MGKINGLEDIHKVPAKVCQMYEAVIQMLEKGVDAAGIHVSDITEKAGIGKGTAYEYFDTREDIVACAIVYHVQWLFEWLENALKERKSFREQLFFLLDEIEKKDGCKNGFLRFVHMMTDNSEFSRMVREKMTSGELALRLPGSVFGRILGMGVERGELRSDLPMDYMIYSLFSHLVTYMLTVTSGECFHTDTATMRALVCRGIMNEIGTGGEAVFYDCL